jgi:hypothetical protein
MDATQIFGPSDIVAATGGNVSLGDLRNWVRDGRFNTPLAEPRAGKPRDFPLFAVFEAVLLREFVSYGVPLDRAKIWNAQILARIVQKGLATVHQSGMQGGGDFGSPEIALFHRDGEQLHILSDTQAGETLSRFFYRGRDSGPAPSLAAIHLPSLLSPVLRSLAVSR